MVRPIDAAELTPALRLLAGQSVYLHMEVTPGGFLRNLRTELNEVVLRCDGPTYRLALRCVEHGWVVLEGLTHMAIPDGAPFIPGRGLLLCTLEGEDRMTRVIEISKEALAA